jgi:trigger factor
MQSVKTLTLPELDDEFANSLGQFENFAELEKTVREQQEINKKQEYEDKYYSDLIAKYAEISTVKFPPFMVEEEIEHMLKSLERDLKQQNLDFDTYLKLLSTDKEKYIEENVRPAAVNRVKSTLIIEQVAQEEKVEVAKEDIDGIINDTVQMLQNMPDQKGKKAKLNDEMVNNVAYNAISRLYNQRTLERMKALASGEIEIETTEEIVEETSEDATETVVEQEIEATEESVEVSSEDATQTAVEQEIEVESNENEQQAESEGEETPKE